MTDFPYKPAHFVTRRRLLRMPSPSSVRAAVAAVGAAGVLAASIALAFGDRGADAPVVRDVAAASVAAPTKPGAGAVGTATAEPAPVEAPGYRLVASDGGVFSHGAFDHAGSATGMTSSSIVGMAQTSDGAGYWLTSADGGVFAFGSAAFFGSAVDVVGTRAVDIAASADDQGYWVATRDGGVFSFGGAPFHGSLVGQPLNSSIVSVASTPSGNGYWLASSDGGVFGFGDAAYYGGAVGNGVSLNSPITSIVPTVSGNGYWLVGRDGGVFAFGDAPFFGSLVGQPLNSPIVDMEVESSGHGYWLVATDGGVFAFGDAPFLGSAAGGHLNAPVIAMAGGLGEVAEVAEVSAASVSAPVRVEPTIPPAPAAAPAPATATAPAIASLARAAEAASRPIDGATGWDISYPQCDGAQPAAPFGFGIVGVNGGRMFKHNRCLAQEWQWARSSGAAGIYVNINFPRSQLELAMGQGSVRQPSCNGSMACVAYNFGWNGIGDALAYADSQGVHAPFAWLDVEQLNYWTNNPELNAVVLRGAIDAVRNAGMDVGIYSTPYQYSKIMGAEAPGVPVWTAGAPGWEAAARYCVERSFGGGPVAFTQLLPGQFDPNLACPGAGPISRYFATN